MIEASSWLSGNYIEVFGAVTGIIYVFLEIRQNIWLWPVGIVTSAVYILVFFTSKFYADMSLQGYYLVISCIGFYWWRKGSKAQRHNGTTAEEEKGGRGEEGKRRMGYIDSEYRPDSYREPNTDYRLPVTEKKEGLVVTRLKLRTGLILAVVFIFLYLVMWLVLSKLTDSPIPEWDSFITALSIIATWMLARKIYEHWYLWIIVNLVSAILFISRGLFPTVVLYTVYLVMSFAGLSVWKKTIGVIKNAR